MVTCKCGGKTVEQHESKVNQGYPGHVFRIQVVK